MQDTEPTLDDLPARTRSAYEQLNKLAYELGPNTQMPKFNELKALLGVSVATLNRALELLEAQRVVYRRHSIGIFVSPSLGQKSIALAMNPAYFVGGGVSPFWMMLMEECRRQTTARGHLFSLHFSGTPSGESELPFFEDFRKAVEEKRIHGVLGVGLSDASRDYLQAQHIPCVGFGNTAYGIGVDMNRLIREAVAALTGAGCRRIGLWLAGNREHPWVAAFRDALTEHNLPFEASLLGFSDEAMPPQSRPMPRNFWEYGYSVAISFFERVKREHWPDGLVIPSEMFAQGALVGMERAGVAAGKTIKIASHANEGSPVLMPWFADIIRFEVSSTRLAYEMLMMLETLIAREEPVESVILLHAEHQPSLPVSANSNQSRLEP